MNVFYEEEGQFKVGAILADNIASLQVEAPYGKRSKIKANAVLFRFELPAIADFANEAQRIAEGLDIDFLWECCGQNEFSYDALAQDYFGRAPSPVESAGILIKLHGAPMYFYKKGRGRYKAAPPDALKAALASIERKRLQAIQKGGYIAQLTASKLPPEFVPLVYILLCRPDRNSIEWKALEEASAALKVSPARLIERCGALSAPHDYHLNRFLFEYFPRGAGFGAVPEIAVPSHLSDAGVDAFSIDDASTTEIDDAFSVDRLPNGNWKIGIHIAAPGLGIKTGSEIDRIARERLSTVYFPGGKITMLPEEAIRRFTLQEDRDCPVLSLYIEATPEYGIVSSGSRIERVRIAANLRHDTLDPVFNAQAIANGRIAHPYAQPLRILWEFAVKLQQTRALEEAAAEQRPEYSFDVVGDRVTITRRFRGTPIDKLVSELMIYANSEWGRQLAESDTAAIFRVHGNGKVRMSTVPASHAGLGVEHYIWATSPLRRYVDLINQRQLIALVHGELPDYGSSSKELLAAMRDFEVTYDAYADFQRTMERYWCLRWLLQEEVSAVTATILRENLVRFDTLPLVARVPSMPALEAGTSVELVVSRIDLLELTFHCEYRKRVDAAPQAVHAAG